jgi:RNA polymerase sigma-70 factor, ECF subfamily
MTLPQKVGGDPAAAPLSEADPLGESTVQILSRARLGDRSAVRTLIERALPPLRRWAHGRIPSYGRGSADTEDLLQDAVLGTLKRLATFEHRTVDALQRYLRIAVVNGVRDIARRVQRRGVPVEIPEALRDVAPSPEEEAIMQERSDKFVEALGRLRPVDRQVIVWRIELGYSYEEIARRQGKSTASARMSGGRALKRLEKEMGIPPRQARA